MRCLSWSFALLAWSAAGLAQTAQKQASIPVHTPVEIELEESISSETLHAGQEIAFRVLRDVMTEERTVIIAGTPVTGTVQAVHGAGAFRQAGWFDLRLKTTRADDGSPVQLEFPRPRVRSSKGEKTATALVSAPVLMYYFPLIPFAVAENAKKGAAYTVRAGERYLVYVAAAGDAAPTQAGKAIAERKPASSPPQ